MGNKLKRGNRQRKNSANKAAARKQVREINMNEEDI